ncbi:MAG: hypothetical protein JXJ19_03100 [Elusimicrobia bacterium]|nr:hypothetical protein [Elusimicrobiota bacterium]
MYKIKGKIITIIQARMGSERLPGKSMMDLSGAPLTGRIIERLKRCQVPDGIVLATTDSAADDGLSGLAAEYNTGLYRGSENDVVDRIYLAAKAYDADVIVRFPADNPVPEPGEIDRMIKHHLDNGNDFSSNLCNIMGNGYPEGIGAEVFSMDILEEIWRDEGNTRLKEHLTLYFYDYYRNELPDPQKYTVGTVRCPENIRRPDIRLAVDTEKEYEFIAGLYRDLYPSNPDFGIKDVVKWYDSLRQDRKKL